MFVSGLCYAEFASMLPVSGSAYTYGYATMGEFIAWIIGWDLILEYLFGSATVAVGWSGYVVSFLDDIGLHLPAQICQSPFAYDINGWHHTGAIINFPAVFIIALMTTLLVIGIRESARFNNVIVMIKVAVILLFIGFGISYINVDNWTPFIPENTGKFSEFGLTGVLTGAAVVFFAYIGFDAVSTTAQEPLIRSAICQRDSYFTGYLYLVVCGCQSGDDRHCQLYRIKRPGTDSCGH